MKTQVKVYRHELKYFIHKREAAALKLFLKNNMYLDSNADETDSYWIRSLYFDTMDNNDYYEKIIGHNTRKKIRLRIYDMATATVKLEIKNKYNNYILKETVAISRDDANKLIRGDCNFLLSYNETTCNKVYVFMHRSIYRPTVIIDYEREAYFYPFQNIRVTLDKNLRASFHSNDLFKKDISMIPVFYNDVFVLEIKYDHMIPISLKRLLSSFETQKSQISKYCLGRSILNK